MIVGIDPGLDGAIALLDTDEARIIVHDMPTGVITKSKTKRYILAEQLADILDKPAITVVWLEQVSSSPQQGVVSAFSFGEGFGIVKGVCAALRIPIWMVPPATWKRRMQCPREKTEARGRAMQLFPKNGGVFDAKKDDGRAEACIIALYGALDQGFKAKSPIQVVLG